MNSKRCITLIAVSFINFSTSIPSLLFTSTNNPVSLSNRAFPCNQWYHVLHRKINYSSFFSIDQCRQLEFRAAFAFRGKRLLNHKIKEVDNVAKDFCGALCFMEPNCVSYNILASNDSQMRDKWRYTLWTPEWSGVIPNSTYRGSKVCL